MANKDLEKRYTELVLENDKLRIANEQLAADYRRLMAAAAPKCGSCENITQHDCFTLHECKFLGFVDPEGPGCQRHKNKKSPPLCESGEVGEIQKGNLLK